MIIVVGRELGTHPFGVVSLVVLFGQVGEVYARIAEQLTEGRACAARVDRAVECRAEVSELELALARLVRDDQKHILNLRRANFKDALNRERVVRGEVGDGEVQNVRGKVNRVVACAARDGRAARGDVD